MAARDTECWVILAWVLLASCTTTEPCPAGFSLDLERAARITRLIAHPEPAVLCFGSAQPSVVRTDGVLLLDASADDRALAARTAHLLDHLRGGEPPPGVGCVEAWMRREERGIGIELEWQRRFEIELTVQSAGDLRDAFRRRCDGGRLESP